MARGVGRLITASSDCIEVTRKKINRKNTMSTMAVMSIKLPWSFGARETGAADDRPAALLR